METGIDLDTPPSSGDLNGWRTAIREDRLKDYRLEAVAAAFQDLGSCDEVVRNALAKHLSKSIVGILRLRVGFHHPNRGEDVIFRVHDAIFEALLRPTSCDGRALREAFVPRVEFRLKDALVVEARGRRLPDGKKEARNAAASLAYDAERHGRKPREACVDETENLDEEIAVKGILDRITDDRKRLAFYLFMNDVPYKSKRKDVHSIAKALGISEKTAREWIKEVQNTLAEDEDVRQLRRLKGGEDV